MTDPTLYRDDSRIFTIRGVQIMLGEVKCCQCDSVAVAAPCGGLRPIGKQTRRAKREPTSQVQFPMRESV